jgi:hypothetical protein
MSHNSSTDYVVIGALLQGIMRTKLVVDGAKPVGQICRYSLVQ